MSETAPIATSDELVDSRAARERHAGRVEVLDKVKALQLLPDGVHVTTEMVAAYYEVDVEAVRKLIQRHREELGSNGLRQVAGREFRDIVSSNPSGGGRPSATLFTRRTILNVGMLLRDSLVAKRVRSYLLDAESSVDLSDPLVALQVQTERTQQAIALALRERTHRRLAEQQVVELEPAAHSWERLAAAEGDWSLREAAQILDRDPAISTGQNRLMAQLRELCWVDATGQPYQSHVDQKLICRRPISYTHPHKGTEQLTYQIRITTKGVHKLHEQLGGQRPLFFGI